LPRWLLWIAGVFIVRGIWNSYSPPAAVVVGVLLLVGYWTYRIVEEANKSPGHRAHAARRELRRIGREIAEALVGWALIALVLFLLLFGIAAIVATWPPNWWLVVLVVVLGVLAILAVPVAWFGDSNLLHRFRLSRWQAREAQLAPVLRMWNASAHLHGPADRAAVDRIVASVYAGNRSPSPLVDWAASPPEFAKLLAEADRHKRLHRPPPWWVFLLPIGSGSHVWTLVWEAAEHDVPRDELEAALVAGIGTNGLETLVAQTSWFSFRKGRAIVLDRPIELHLDGDGALHSSIGPAVRFADGWRVWALHGVVVPGEAIEDQEGFDPLTALQHENVEVRRVLLDHLGWDRVIQAARLKPTMEDEHGRLWRLPTPDGDPVLLLEVENASPDHDGTHRRYFLRVPPDMESPRAATAWTFGLSELEYAPELES